MVQVVVEVLLIRVVGAPKVELISGNVRGLYLGIHR